MDQKNLGKNTAIKKTNALSGNFMTSSGKIPPQALDFEEAVLGALMLEKNALTAVIDILHPEVFYKQAHQKIFKAIQNLFASTEPIDILTVSNKLKSEGELEEIGGAYYITQLTNRVASSANIEYHARILMQKFVCFLSRGEYRKIDKQDHILILASTYLSSIEA